MAYEIKGKIKQVNEAQTFSSGFTKREFVVTVEDGKYPQDIIFETLQDKVGMLDGLAPETEVDVSFDIRGRAYNDRHFNNLVCWKIDVLAQDAPSEPQNAPSDFIGAVNDALGQVNNETPQIDSEIPF